VAPGPARFADFEIDVSARELRRGGELIRLQDLPFRVLAALVERPGEVVTRAELRERLWGTETFVDYEAGLNTAIAKLRDALGDNAEHPTFIETLPKRGYRFVGKLEGAAGGRGSSGPSDVESNRADVGSANETGPFVTPARRTSMWLAGLALVVAVGLSLYWVQAPAPPIRIAVVLFDNETGNPEFDRLAQQLTDATVLKLTARTSLAVVGNAAVLRTTRPFRDIVVIRDALHVSYIVIGQLQRVDGAIRAQAHLIRTDNQTHLWADRVPVTMSDEAAAQEQIASRIDHAVSQKVLGLR